MHSYSAGKKNKREMGRSSHNRRRISTNTVGRGRNGGRPRSSDQNSGPVRPRDPQYSRQRGNSEQNRSNSDTENECGKCSQEVKDDDWALFCESERKWYIEYDEVSEEEYEAYRVLERFAVGGQSLYFCKKCIEPTKRMVPVICGLEELKQDVTAKLEEVEQKNKELVEKIGGREERIGDEIGESVEEKRRELTEEQEDRKKSHASCYTRSRNPVLLLQMKKKS